ncbi:MAG: hypothetical protein ACRDLB_14045 [Actinomycetota bacterium]
MFGKKNADARTGPLAARGGISLLSIFTGVLVALGTLFLLSALVAGIIEAIDDLDTSDTTVEIGVGAGIAFIVAQFIAYLWGGYTAARMGRGAGLAHGILVPVLALILAAIVAGIATALGAVANLGLPFTETRLPVERNYLIEWGTGVGVGSLVAMFVGGIIGGVRGARWHTSLESAAVDRAIEAEAGRASAADGPTERQDLDADRTGRRDGDTVRTEPPDDDAPTTRPPATEGPASGPLGRPIEPAVPPAAVPPPAAPADDTGERSEPAPRPGSPPSP